MEQINTVEEITPFRLKNFGGLIREYISLLKYKCILREKINTLKSIDYTRDKVQTGNGSKLSEQERYTLKLERINQKCREYKGAISKEWQVLGNQISRVSRWEYRELLTQRYIYRQKSSELIEKFFQSEPDFEERKEDKYREKFFYWQRRALEEIHNISLKPYIPTANQLYIKEFHY